MRDFYRKNERTWHPKKKGRSDYEEDKQDYDGTEHGKHPGGQH